MVKIVLLLPFHFESFCQVHHLETKRFEGFVLENIWYLLTTKIVTLTLSSDKISKKKKKRNTTMIAKHTIFATRARWIKPEERGTLRHQAKNASSATKANA